MRKIVNPLRKVTFLLILVLSYPDTQGQSWKEYPYTPEELISFPFDEGRHPEDSIEWWYVAGHLTGESTQAHYSLMLSYFYYPLLSYDGFRILNLCNDDTGEFFSEPKALTYTVMGIDSLNIQAQLTNGIIEVWANKTDDKGVPVPFEYLITASGSPGSLDISCMATKRPLILGDSGYIKQGDHSYSYYYSLTGNEVTGTISFNGIDEEVRGTAWIDRQYGNFNPLTEEKYEWFFLNLSNGMDLNIWNLFTPDNQILTLLHIACLLQM
jgi:predicted secreted hydrolase